ncbi:unnamed protein product [Oppiella nova]|uniref:Thioredoxin domain-containing protein n=1 Tax=Oppiella nova TaxID=334625 RepID=A0A7R9QCH2_9ACAR|nr:unnamed protein product [Oppiella nova]CAG2163002.1 unnamed protein product [Oppiella nova]
MWGTTRVTWIKRGKVNCQTLGHLCREAAVNAYPTLKLYDKSAKSAKGIPVEGFGAKDIVPFVENFLSDSSQEVKASNRSDGVWYSTLDFIISRAGKELLSALSGNCALVKGSDGQTTRFGD